MDRNLQVVAERRASRLLRRAVALDPDYTYAKALICFAHTGAFATRWWPFDRAREAIPMAHAVLDTNPDDALTLAYVGHYIAYVGQDPRRGLTALKQATRVNPNSATVAMLIGWVHNYLGEYDAALEHLQRAQRLSPFDPQIGAATSGIAQALVMTKGHAAAVGVYEQALTEYPEFATIFLGLIGCYWHLGRMDDARRMAEKLRAKAPDTTISSFRAARFNLDKDYIEMMTEALEGLGFAP